MAGLPSDSLPSPGVASPENASPDSAGLLTVSVSNLRFKTATTPRFVGKVKVSWPDGSPTQRKTSLSCPAGRIVVLALEESNAIADPPFASLLALQQPSGDLRINWSVPQLIDDDMDLPGLD